jgi:hypothetical protein
MIDPRWVTAHGKRILVETLETPGMRAREAKRARRRKEAFVMLPLQWAADAARATKTPMAMVLILLQYMAWKTKSQTFPLRNALIAQYGVDRYAKYRALRKLEQAGVIRVLRQNKQASIVTLL